MRWWKDFKPAILIFIPPGIYFNLRCRAEFLANKANSGSFSPRSSIAFLPLGWISTADHLPTLLDERCCLPHYWPALATSCAR
jgi:hypothetical protein